LARALEGEAGVGYMLKTGFFLPPLMFGADELEALVLGARWVRRQGDEALAAAASNALAKIAAATPKDLRDDMAETSCGCRVAGRERRQRRPRAPGARGDPLPASPAHVVSRRTRRAVRPRGVAVRAGVL
jgi:predicted DNA-binding transcriptional regulator YafY